MARKGKAPDITREELEKLAKEVNTVLNLDKPIKFSKKTTDEELTEMILAETKGNVYEIDFTPDPEDDTIPYFTEEADNLIEQLGIEVLEGAPPAPAEEPEEVEETQEELPLEEEPVPEKSKGKGKPAPAAKGKATQEPTPAPTKGKPAPAKGKVAPAAKPPVKKVKNVEPFTRNNALVAALLQTTNKPMSKQEVCKLSDDLYVEHGGKSGAFVSEVMYRYTVPALVELGLIEKTKEGKISYKG